jgi:hypothetical protein
MNEPDLILKQGAGGRVLVSAGRQIELVLIPAQWPERTEVRGHGGREVSDRKRHAGDFYSRNSVNVMGSAYDIYERGSSDLENGPLGAGAHAPGSAGGFAGRF